MIENASCWKTSIALLSKVKMVWRCLIVRCGVGADPCRVHASRVKSINDSPTMAADLRVTVRVGPG